MSIMIKLGPGFLEYAGNCGSLEVPGDTVRESLDGLIARYPVFGELLFDSQHSLTALLIHQGEVIVQNQLDRRVEDPRELLVLPMVYGG